MRRRGGAGFPSIPRFYQITEGFYRPHSTPHFFKSTDDIADHVAQERRGLDGVDEQLAALFQ